MSFSKLKSLEYARVLRNFTNMIFTKRESFADEELKLTFPMVKYCVEELYQCGIGFSNKTSTEFIEFALKEAFPAGTYIDPLVPDYLSKRISFLASSPEKNYSYFEKTVLPPKEIHEVTVFSALAYVLLTLAEYNDIREIILSDVKYAMNIILLEDSKTDEVDTDPQMEVGNGLEILEDKYGLTFSEEAKEMFKKCIFHIMSFCFGSKELPMLQRQRVCMFASYVP
jgi:hypothetical protein